MCLLPSRSCQFSTCHLAKGSVLFACWLQVHAELVLDVPVEHGLLLENLLDLVHLSHVMLKSYGYGVFLACAAAGAALLYTKACCHNFTLA